MAERDVHGRKAIIDLRWLLAIRRGLIDPGGIMIHLEFQAIRFAKCCVA